MVYLFQNENTYYAVETAGVLSTQDIKKLEEFYLNAKRIDSEKVSGPFVGPHTTVETPWSTNAVSAISNPKITRIEKYQRYEKQDYDPMLKTIVSELGQDIFRLCHPETMCQTVSDINSFNKNVGLALSDDEIKYLHKIADQYSRSLTDAELALFAQVNSEHCRHKIFNGTFRIDDTDQPSSLFQLIKNTFAANPNSVVSAYADNAAAFHQSKIPMFGYDKNTLVVNNDDSCIIVKAETHNHPTGVSAFPGAATGTGGEIRDRMGMGRGSWPIAGGAAYLVPELRLYPDDAGMPERQWLYQTPVEILIRASNGASDYGNKIGQPLIYGSVLTFEQEIDGLKYGYDKPIMLASGCGLVKSDSLDKIEPAVGMVIILLGGKNYRIGIGGCTSASVNLGTQSKTIELNSVQRDDAEMQRRVLKVIEWFAKYSEHNPILSIHDHGAGGHGNCFSELVGEAGGEIWLDALPIGDGSLTYMDIIGNESQERMGILIKEEDWPLVQTTAERENCPAYLVGKITGSGRFVFRNRKTNEVPFDMSIDDMFGNPPKTVMKDISVDRRDTFTKLDTSGEFNKYLDRVVRRPEVASKGYLVDKVDRSVSGLVVQQQCVGPLQAPVADYALTKKSLLVNSGIAMSQGLAPVPSLVDIKGGVRLALVETLTNLILSGVEKRSDIVLSANWMWPCRNEGEDIRLYTAVEALSTAAIELGINIPTGKDSCSMTQKYPDDSKVIAPGTVIISGFADVPDIRKAVTPELRTDEDSTLIHIDFSDGKLSLGGSSFALAQNRVGDQVPQVDMKNISRCLEAIMKLVNDGLVIAGHDISDGGRIVTLLEMCFAAGNRVKIDLKCNFKRGSDLNQWMFAQNPGLVLQVNKRALKILEDLKVSYEILADKIQSAETGRIAWKNGEIDLAKAYADWSETSLKLEEHQTSAECVKTMRQNLEKQPLSYIFPKKYGENDLTRDKVIAAVIRDEGTNGEMEMQYALHLAGFKVRDVTMTDLVSGRETLEDIRVVVFAGGFSNSDVLGSAVGWAGKFKFNAKAKKALERFLDRSDTLSLGICNGCQLMAKLGVIRSRNDQIPSLLPNESGRFESAFVNVNIPKTNTVWLRGLEGSRLGVWIAHGEGRFSLPGKVNNYNVALKYSYAKYPGNPNGSQAAVAGIASLDGRHLIMMPHPERVLHPGNCPDYPKDRRDDSVTPWIELFNNAYRWCLEN